MAWSWSSVPEEQAAFLAPGLAPVTPVRTSRWPPVAMDGPMGQWACPSPWTDRPEQALAPFLACLSAPGPHGSKLACWCPVLTFQWVDRMGPPLLSWPIPPHFFHAGDARFPPTRRSSDLVGARSHLAVVVHLSSRPISLLLLLLSPVVDLFLPSLLSSSRLVHFFSSRRSFSSGLLRLPVSIIARLYLNYLPNSEEEFFC